MGDRLRVPSSRPLPDYRAPLHRVAAHVFAVAVILLAPGAGLAQTVDLGGHAGFHLPVGSLIEGPPIEKRLLASLSAGLDAYVWAGRVGFAGKVTYSSARVAVTQPGNVQDRDASVILANARLLFALTPLTLADGTMPPMAFYLGAGAGLVNRSGAIWAYESGLTAPALVFERGRADPRRAADAVMRIEVEDYISRAQFNVGEPSETAAQTHHDVTLSLSLCYRVLH